jgi:pimeloyl-ACP methyl ester carboxylesterase
MPYQKINGANYYYESHGEGDETIVMSHGLLMSCRMFDAQIEAFSRDYRVIVYDHRGQGQTGVTDRGYDLDTLTDDAVEIIDTFAAAPCHFVGLSMGGFVGQRLAVRHPDLLRSLVMLNTSADPEPPENLLKYRMLGLIGRWLSLKLIIGRVMPIMFGETFMSDPSRAPQRMYWRQHIVNNDPKGIYRALMDSVVKRDGMYDELHTMTTPTLILAGEEDVATVPAKSERMHERIPNSKLVMIPGAGHSSSVEQPERVNAEIRAFLNAL